MGIFLAANVRTSKLILLGILLAFLSGCGAEFRKFWNDPSNKPDGIGQSHQGATVRFLGVSSFLIKDGDATIMIDGYLSRPDNFLFKRIAPAPARIKKTLCAMDVQLSDGCDGSTSAKDNLDAVFVMHGHFDHAMDSPFIACVTGATLVGGPVVNQIADRTKRFFPDSCGQISYEPLDEESKQFTFDDYHPILVTLVTVPHSDNLGSKILENAMADPDWTFPARVTQMKLGVSVAAHLKLRQGSILIVPTAGDISGKLDAKRFETDTIFLGVGALGFTCKEKAREYWKNTVLATKAKWVVPIHWDSFTGSLVSETGPFDPEAVVTLESPFYEKLDRVLSWFQEFAAESQDVTLRPVPILKPFDPFFQTRPLN